MKIVTDTIRIQTDGNDHIIDLTGRVQEIVVRHRFEEGQALVFVSGSTAGVTTIEYEPGLIEDLPAAFERLAPRSLPYKHEESWHDGNGHSHVRASLLGPSLTIPVAKGRLLLGTWQQIIVLDFDVRPRWRDIVVQLTGRVTD
jgi:secondary thiamine-phosphate synthase enzyme